MGPWGKCEKPRWRGILCAEMKFGCLRRFNKGILADEL